jgi:hydrogenase maturation protein HypF
MASRPDHSSQTAPRPVRYRLRIRGTVQGLGFRPFVYRNAAALALGGWVANTDDGVVLEIEGSAETCNALATRLREAPPRAAVIDDIEVETVALLGERAFEIRASRRGRGATTQILPDLATCSDCLAEVLDPCDRRYRYPFTNCTQCGPRFSVIERLPYDRAHTSMKPFALCAACEAEYENPENRRFHAEATACPACGPHLALWDTDGRAIAARDEALGAAAEALRRGLIVAIKNLGGFHLCVDARNEEAVQRLRDRKRRPGKPFALLYPSLADAEASCLIDATEAALLAGPEAPIVLLGRRPGPHDSRMSVAAAVAPGNDACLGVMLPSTPLHHLLIGDLGFPIVATSANVSGEPLVIDEHEALVRLAGIADRFLVHDRAIVRPVDDSVLRVVAGRPLMLRRSRGFAPAPQAFGSAGNTMLAVGGHLKSTLAITVGKDIIPSQHLGTLASPMSRAAHTRTIDDFLKLYAIEPELVACDMHPDYFTTRWAEQSGLPVVRVQHHVAHVAACMAEHGLEGPVLGVAWDGTGFGPDGTIWGGEFLKVGNGAYERVAHLRRFPLPGAERAVAEPRRAAVGLLYARYAAAALEWTDLAPVAAFTAAERQVLGRALERGVNSPETSSIGRLFDAVAALSGLCQVASFEGEAAASLEWALKDSENSRYYRFAVEDAAADTDVRWIVDWGPALDELLAELGAGLPAAMISAAFHNGLIRAIVDVARQTGEKTIVLTGGCFQNARLTAGAAASLRQNGFEPYWHERIPPNDGGLAVGQAAYASALLRRARACA